jgi:8-oxo-dGTP diphosphatase
MNQTTSDTQYYQQLPKKRSATGVVFINNQDEILLVNPTYKNHWGIPGGSIDDNESPREAGIREIKEELGLKITHLKLLVVDYVPKNGERGDWYQFIFFGGRLDDEQIQSIELPLDELSEFRFSKAVEASKELSPHTSDRIKSAMSALKNNCIFYLENSKPVN